MREDDRILGDDDNGRVRGDGDLPRWEFASSLICESFLLSGQNVEQIHRSIIRKTVNNPAPHAHEEDVHLSG